MKLIIDIPRAEHEAIKTYCQQNEVVLAVYAYIANGKKVGDVKPIVHAYWIEKSAPLIKPHDEICYTCSSCGETNDIVTNYCPHCGARMGKYDNP